MTVRLWRWPVRVGLLAALLSVLVVVQTSPARADYALLEGDGSTWSKGIIDQWIADAQPMGMRVVYNGIGSTNGRSSFANAQDDFAISEIPYQGTDEQGNSDSSSRPYAYMPIVAGGTSFAYHVEQAGTLMSGIRLSGETIVKIFTNQITHWNDPQIAADNNGRTFPDLPIVPVVRSDGSGTTAQFTRWMDKQFPSMWSAYHGRAGLTSFYSPLQGKMLAQSGSDGVMNYISSTGGNGSIGYVEYSYALNKQYPVVKVLNAAGYYVEPTAYNVAVALTKARIETSNPDPSVYLTQILDDVYNNTDPRAYPLSSYSYLILPTGSKDPRMSTAKRQTLVDFMAYALCTGQQQAGPYGYSPMPLNLVQAGMEQLKKLQAADAGVDIAKADVNITDCGNPTFTAGNLAANCLASVAPMPYDTDKAGNGPNLTGSNSTPTGSCLNDAGSASPTSSGGSGSSGGGGSTAGGTSSGAGGGSGSTTVTGGAGASTDGAAGTTQIDPETGLPVGEVLADGSSGSVTGAVATTVPARPVGASSLFGVLSAAELVALVVVPGVLLARRRRAEQTGGAA